VDYHRLPVLNFPFFLCSFKMSKTFTYEEIKQYKTAEKCVIVIHNKVYDITQFLGEHPGGEEVLLDAGGRNATNDFEDVGHSDEAHEIMKKYYIGDIADSKPEKKVEKKEEMRNTKAATPTNISTSSESSNSSFFNILIPIGLLAIAIVAYAVLGRN